MDGIHGLSDGPSFVDAWCRWPRGPYFSLLVQRKVSKRNTPRRSARRCAAGTQSRREFSDGASCPGRKRRTSLCAALRVLPAGTAGPQGPQEPRLRDPRLQLRFCLPSCPHEARRAGRVKPEGRRHGRRRFRMAQGCAIRKFPARPRTRSEAQGVPPGACFFGSFLCTSKERDAPAASGAMRGPSGLFRKAIKRTGRQHGKLGDRGFVAPLPNPSPAGRGASSWGR